MERTRTLLYPIFWIRQVLIIIFIPLFVLYRRCIAIYLTYKYGEKFKGFLDGSDILFTLSGDSAKGDIGAIFYIPIETSDYECDKTATTILNNLKKHFHNVFFTSSKKLPKLFYQRKLAFGYNFWLDEDPGSIEKYVRPLRFDTVEEFITIEDFQKVVGARMNTDLPDGHTRCWEILIGMKPIVGENVVKFPVVLRLIHSLTDALGITRLFHEYFSDTPTELDKNWNKPAELRSKECVQEIVRKWIHTGIVAAHKATLTFHLKPKEINFMHPKRLIGKKIIHWIHEDDGLLDTLKALKKYYIGRRFNDILVAVISQALDNFFKYKSENLRSSFTIFLPDGANNDRSDSILCNKFFLTKYTLPLPHGLSNEGKVKTFSRMLEGMIQEATPIHPSLDIEIQHQIIYWIAAYYPQPIVNRIILQDLPTICVSPFPGITHDLQIAGYACQNFTFFTTNTGNLGINIVVSTFSGRLQLTISADLAAIKSEADLKLLMNCIVDEIKGLRNAFGMP